MSLFPSSSAEFGPLWEPWEVDEIGRKVRSYLSQIVEVRLSFLRYMKKTIPTGIWGKPAICQSEDIFRLVWIMLCTEVKEKLGFASFLVSRAHRSEADLELQDVYIPKVARHLHP